MKDQEMRSNIIALLRSGVGFGVELFGALSVDALDGNEFRVLDQRDASKPLTDGEDYRFTDVKRAVDFFLQIRQERKLGYDFSEVTPLHELMEHIENTNMTPDKKNPQLVNIHGKIPLAVLEKAREAVDR